MDNYITLEGLEDILSDTLNTLAEDDGYFDDELSNPLDIPISDEELEALEQDEEVLQAIRDSLDEE